jgi:hypothetical protein
VKVSFDRVGFYWSCRVRSCVRSNFVFGFVSCDIWSSDRICQVVFDLIIHVIVFGQVRSFSSCLVICSVDYLVDLFGVVELVLFSRVMAVHI